MSVPETDPALAVADVVDRGDVLMLTSPVRHRDALGDAAGATTLEARPVMAVEVMGGRITAIVSAIATWVVDLESASETGVILTVDQGGRYAALSGVAMVDDDPARVVRLWNHAAEAFVSGPDDPHARLLDVTVTGGEWWRAPSTGIGTALSVVGEVVLGRPAHSGARGPVTTDSDVAGDLTDSLDVEVSPQF